MRGLVVAAVISALATNAQGQIRDWPSAGGFDISQSADSCMMAGRYPIEGRAPTQLAVVVTADGATVGLSSWDWASVTDQAYNDLTFLIGDRLFEGTSYGFVSGIDRGFLVNFDLDVLDTIARADRILVRRGDIVVANLGLAGSAAGVDLLKRCSAYASEQRAAQARREARVAYIARDPFAETNPGDEPERGSPPKPAVLTNPSWSARPDPEFPEQASSTAVYGGSVEAECTVGSNGSLEACSILSETPSGLGFGQALLASTQRARLSPRSVDSVAAGGKVRFRHQFVLT